MAASHRVAYPCRCMYTACVAASSFGALAIAQVTLRNQAENSKHRSFLPLPTKLVVASKTSTLTFSSCARNLTHMTIGAFVQRQHEQNFLIS